MTPSTTSLRWPNALVRCGEPAKAGRRHSEAACSAILLDITSLRNHCLKLGDHECGWPILLPRSCRNGIAMLRVFFRSSFHRLSTALVFGEHCFVGLDIVSAVKPAAEKRQPAETGRGHDQRQPVHVAIQARV